MSTISCLYAGRFEEARLSARSTRSLLDHIPGPPRLYAFKLLAEAAFVLDERDLAADLYERLLPYAGRCAIGGGGATAYGAVSQSLGLCAMTGGDLDTAVRWLRSAVDRNRSFGAGPYVAASQADLADALLRRGDDPAEAADLLADAAATAERLGMDRLGARVEALRATVPSDADADDRTLARAVAVLGAQADRGLLAAACDLPAERFLAALARAPQPATDVTPDEGRADRLRAAEAIERLGMHRRHRNELARLRLAALPLGDPATAVRATLDAARAALHRFDPVTAADLCTAALDRVAPYGATARVWRAELLTVLGTAQAATGDRSTATQTLTEAADLADLTGARAVAIEATLAMPLDARYEPGSCGPVETRLRGLLDAAPAPYRVRIMARLGADALASRPGATSEREELVDRAVDEARSLDDGRILVEVLCAWHRTVLGPARIDERLARGAETVELARRHDMPANELEARLNLFTTLLTAGRIDQAEAELHRYEDLATRIGEPLFLMYARSRRATLATLRGRFADAERLAREAYEAGRSVTPDAKLLYELQSFARALARGETDHDACASSVQRTATAYPLVVALIMERDGRPDEAREQLRTSMNILDMALAGFELYTLSVVADLASRLGDADCAAEVARRLSPYAHHVAVAGTGSVCTGSTARSLGRCAATTGDLDTAATLLRDGIAADRRLGALPFVAFGAHELAAVLFRRNGPGDAAEAATVRAEAASIASTLGMTLPDNALSQAPDRVALNRHGDSWALTYEGRTSVLRASKGVAQLAVLIANPGRDIAAIELAGGVDSNDRMQVIDETAKLNYRKRMSALQTEMEHGDAATVAKASREYDAIVRTVKRATGLGGRTRLASSEAERARINVTRTLRQAIDQILAIDEAAGLHLHAGIRTGTRCRYESG
ncbi:hypothetical protein [Virgisporangium aurantiacum]|nr:hypothetical protein [Virgisporangium aurantiacum]